MKQKFLYLAMLVVALTITLFSCRQNKEIIPSSEYAPYISAYTGGLISTGSTIKIEFAQEKSSVELHAEIKDKLFDFSPSLKGKAYWVNNKTIEFVPDSGQLKQGELYNVTFKLKKVVNDVDKKLSEFPFSFRVIAQDFAIQTSEFDVTASDPKSASVSGKIQFSDVPDLNQVKKMLSAKTDDNQNVTIDLKPTQDLKVFEFVVSGIKRGESDITLTINGDGKFVNIDKFETREVIIPGTMPFKYVSASSISEPENGIQVVFSEPISQSQDLRGLISIPELSSTVFQMEGNKVNIFFEQTSVKNVTLKIDQGIRSSTGKTLSQSSTISLALESLKPAVEIPYSGTILPDSKNLILPFRAVNIKAVDVKVVQIFENNVLMFMQSNGLDGSNELRRSGRLIYKKTLHLDSDPSKNLHIWENYSIDLANIIKRQPGAIYRIELSFNQSYSVYPCGGNETNTTSSSYDESLTRINSEEISEEEEAEWDKTSTYYWDSGDIDWEVYDWEQTENPCHASYYMVSSRKAACNVLASNIGIIAKASTDQKLWLTVNDILTATPMKDVELKAYNFQLQQIGNAKTDGDGFAEMDVKGKPFAVVAEANQQKTYLRLADGEDKSLSRFDVGGKEIKKGLKGFVYGERGVWRPGDTLHISFMLEDRQQKIPSDHPVSIEVYNPRGQFYSKVVSTNGVNGLYAFNIPTKQEDPTGLWNAYVKVGGATFHKSLRIETIKPNRLKINLDFKGSRIDAFKGDVDASLNSAWLTGAIARNLKAKVEMTLNKTNTQFKGYEKYIFNNPATNFTTDQLELFDGILNEEGNVNFTAKIPPAKNAPGMLRANIVCRVFEPGGDASIYSQTIPFAPFASYVGINFNNADDRYIETDSDHSFDVVTLSADGKPVDRKNLEYKVYKVKWSWWWQNNDESFESYVNNTSIEPVLSGNLSTVNGKAKINFRINYPEWGRYLIYVKDRDGGHATGGLVYVDWPAERGRSDKSDPSGLTMLTFSTNKTSYEVGEEVTVLIPSAAAGNALIALENGSSVIKRDWVAVSEGNDTKYKFKVTEEMAPNFYIHISLLQPHAQTVNNLPIRMYGVVPVFVTNKNSELTPQISMPKVLRPETEFAVKVSEKNGKEMSYTLAIVDDGLLDLTNFKTPDPWSEFYAREALGVKTWDMYDYVIGAFAGKFGSLFSIGGDEDMKPSNQKANRFKPVVKFIGPFSLKKGATATHKIKLPMYVGSVRAMVVAGQNGAYGKAEKTVPVRSPLMVLSTLPRVISTVEEIQLPVNVFAMENGVNNVTVKVETSGKLKITDGTSKSLKFSKPGDDLVYFTVKSGTKTGVEKVKVTATGGGHTATETIEIDVRNPNPPVITLEDKLLGAGKTEEFSYNLSERSDENWVKMEVSRIPSVDISRRFDYLYDYQHYCSEQLTSKAFPLLFISQFKDLSSQESEMIKKNVQEAIKNLYGRQLSDGGFVYWPGQSSASEWITTYAGNFLVEAQSKGYEVNPGVINKWKNFQRKAAQNWTFNYDEKNNMYYYESDLQQAYRLYTLALAGSPELGAMNRMKEMKNISIQAKWRLAAAYAIDGKKKAAGEIIFNIQTTIPKYNYSWTYGSSSRDDAMILETMVLMGNMQNAFRQAQQVSRNMSSEYYFSTQSTAFSLVAMGRLAEKNTQGSIEFDWTLNGKVQKSIITAKSVYQISIPTDVLNGKISIRSKSKGDLYVSITSKTKPINDTLPAVANNLQIDVTYTDLKGKPIDVTELKQGTDFIAEVRVTNISGTTDYENIALTQIMPSGWEIFNERMVDHENESAGSSPDFTYQDIRDDRVLTYFDLGTGTTNYYYYRTMPKVKTFKIRLQAAYIGTFTLPAIQCEAMYNTDTQARTTAGIVKVVR